MSDLIVTIAHVRAAGLCVNGSRAWFTRHGLDFRAFLRDELKPEIARRYRVDGESALVGESLAGLFVLDTLVAEPALFDDWIAIDPAVWWNDKALLKGLNTYGGHVVYEAVAQAHKAEYVPVTKLF